MLPLNEVIICRTNSAIIAGFFLFPFKWTKCQYAISQRHIEYFLYLPSPKVNNESSVSLTESLILRSLCPQGTRQSAGSSQQALSQRVLCSGRSGVNGAKRGQVLLAFQQVVLHQELLHLPQQLLWGERVQVWVSQTGGSISCGFLGAVPLFS